MAERTTHPTLEFGEKFLYMLDRGGKWEPRSRSVCWHAELVVRGSSCHRASAGRSRHARRTSRESLSRRYGTRTEYSECEPFHGLRMAVTKHSTSKFGMERPAGVVPRSPGEVLMENKAASAYLGRPDFERWALAKVVLGAGT